MKVRWTKTALRDLEIIGDYTARESSADGAAKVVTAILDRIDFLKEFPQMGRAGRIPNTRELVVLQTPYIVPYRVRYAMIEILAVFHGARRWPEKFD